MNCKNPPPYPPYLPQLMGPMEGPYPPSQGYPYPGYPQYGWQGAPQEPHKTTVYVVQDQRRDDLDPPPASQPAGLLSVAAASKTCLPNQPSPPAPTLLPPSLISVLSLSLLNAKIND